MRLTFMRSRAEKQTSPTLSGDQKRGEVANLIGRISLGESNDTCTPRDSVFEPFSDQDTSVNTSTETVLTGFPLSASRSAPRSPCKKRRATFDSVPTDDMEDSFSESSSSSHKEIWMDVHGLPPRYPFDSSSKPIPIPKPSPSASLRDSPGNSLDDSRLSHNNTLLRSPNNSMISPTSRALVPSSPLTSKILSQSPSPSHCTGSRPVPPWDTSRKSPIAPMRLFPDEGEETSSLATDQARKPLFPITPRVHSLDGIPNQNPFKSPFSASIIGTNSVPRSNGRFCREFAEATKIGSGSFGDVFKAIKRLDLCAYAVKIVQMRKAMRYYLKEVQALATQAENPFMVRYFDCWVEEEKLYILFELCEGTLADRTRTGPPMSEAELCQVACNALMGLNFMHENNLAHLDVKPANLYMSQNGSCKIGDLGLVASADATFEAEDGDNRYLCPELLQGSLTDLRKADIFSLGATLYELARWMPLPGTGDEYHAIRNGSIVFPPDINPDLAAAISEMMHPNSLSRPSCAQLLSRPLFAQYLRAAPNFSEVVAGMAETAPKLHNLANSLKEERLERIRLSEENREIRIELESALHENIAIRVELESLRALFSAATDAPSTKNRRLDLGVK